MRIPIIPIIIIFTVSFLTDMYIWRDIRRNTAHTLWARLYLGFSIACWIFLAIAMSLPRRGENDILPVMWMLYGYLTVYIPKLIFTIFSMLGGLPRLWRGRTLRTGLYAGLPLGLLMCALMWWGAFSGRTNINVSHVDIDSAKIPQSFDGYRIVQFSDAHTGTWGTDTTFISTLVDTINSLHPDIIVFTGDIVNRHTNEINPFVNTLSRLHAPQGIYSILGNHDYGDYMDWATPQDREKNNRRLLDIQKQMGWTTLNNSSIFLHSENDSITLIGVENWGEPPFHQYGDLGKAYSFSPDSTDNLNDCKFKILLSHNPEHWRQEVARCTNIDLTLSGHTHAMQFMITIGNWRWSPSQYRYEQWGGLYEQTASDGTPVRIYVNIGCGEVGMPFRVGATPEVTLITLHHKSK